MAAASTTLSTLRTRILSGEIPAGARLGEAQLAEQLAVSRTPIREALSRLAAEGLVDLVPNRGARVTTWTAEQLREIFELRLSVEPAIVEAAVPRLDDDQLDRLDELAAEMTRLGRPGRHQDLEAVVELNQAFHAEFVTASGNTAFAAALRTVTHPAVVRRNYSDYDAASLARSLHHHHELVTAARAVDARWAGAVMRSHLHNARAAMLGGTESS